MPLASAVNVLISLPLVKAIDAFGIAAPLWSVTAIVTCGAL